jgi:Family of unknown function (DUF6292)
VELDTDGRAARGLRRYLGLVADELSVGGAVVSVQLDEPVRAYLPLDGRLGRFHGRDVALVWDEENGWAVGIETDAGSPVVVLTYLGKDVLPAPRVVAEFVGDVFDERFPGQPDPPGLRSAKQNDDLMQRLMEYAPRTLPFTVPGTVLATGGE